MASISDDPGGYRRILFTAHDGRRKTIRLGKVCHRVAVEIKHKVEALAAATTAGVSIDGETARWLAEIGDDLHAKLAVAGLVTQRQNAVFTGATLAQYIADYQSHRADVGKGTSTNYGIIGARLLAFFPADRQLHTVTQGDADRWLVWLKTEYAGATVSKSVKIARQFWAQAIRDGLTKTNPFLHLRTPSEVNTARAYFIDRPTFAQVMTDTPFEDVVLRALRDGVMLR